MPKNSQEYLDEQRITNIINQCRTAQRYGNGEFKDNSLKYSLFEALYEIQEKKLTNLKHILIQYALNDPCEEYRELAIRTLGYGFGKGLYTPDFYKKAYDLWLNDRSNSVKKAALSEWSSIHYFNTVKETNHQNNVIKTLNNIIENNDNIDFKKVALSNLLLISKNSYVTPELLQEIQEDTSELKQFTEKAKKLLVTPNKLRATFS